MEKAAVTAVCWVPKGRCSVKRPEAMMEDEDARSTQGSGSASASVAVQKAKATANAISHGLEEFDLDNYDEDDDNQDGMQFFSVLKTDGELAREKDPHLQGDPDSDSEAEFDEIKPEDNVFLAVSCEEDMCQMEVYVFDEEDAKLYVHHDVMFTAYPLCIEWLSDAGLVAEGSFAAVGLIDHSIQVWDIEEIEPMEPVRCLGKEKKGKKKKKAFAMGAGGTAKAHDGPVLSLHGSNFNRNVLVSGSADETLKVWDVSQNECVHTYTHHTDKVQCVRWHPTEQAVLLSAAFDRRLAFMDVRQPTQVATAELPAEAESAMWCRHSPFECLVSVDNGGVACYDIRKVVGKADGSRLWTLMAHDVACTSVQDVPTKDLLVTSGLDGKAKVWNIANGAPRLCMSKDLKAGPLFTCQSSSESPALLSFGGRCPVIWDLTSEQLLVEAFGFPAPPDDT